MYFFGNKRTYGEKAKQQATRERVAPTEIPSFHGKIDHDAYLEWETEMEYVFNCYYFTEAMKVKVAAIGFCGHTINWWLGIASTRRRNRQLQISSWSEMKVVMKKRFAPDQKLSTKDPIQQTTSRSKGDIRPINEGYKPNLEELNNESTCFRNSAHQGVTEKKNWSKIICHEEVIQLSSGRISSESEKDQRLPIEGFQSNQDEPSCKPSCFGNLIHQRLISNWIHVKTHYGLKVIQLLNQEMPSLPYLEGHRFNHLQTRIWRPGEVYNHSEDISNHPGGSSIILEGSDLRANPFKGGGDGAISISLNFKDLKINHESNNHDHFPQPTSYGGHFGRAKSHLVHAESRDGRISLLPDRSELVRPPEQLHEVTLVSMEPMHVSAHSKARNKAQEAQEDIKDELGLLLDVSKKIWVEQGPYTPMKLKDRPPWASTTYYGRGLRREEEEWANLLVQLF